MGVLENLEDDECALWAILSDPSGLDQAEFLMYDAENEDGIFRAWPYQWKWWRDTQQQQIDQSARCCKVGQLVLTDSGWKPIEEVQVGEFVLTHKNRWRRVLGSFDRGIKETVSIGGYGVSEPLVFTPDHKFWLRDVVRGSISKDGHKKKKLLDPAWVAISDFKRNDGSQQMATNWASPSTIAPLPFNPIIGPSYRSGQQNYVENILNLDWLWLFGLYLAEGSTYLDDRYARVTWSVHDDEVEYVSSRLSKVGLKYCLDKCKVGACTRIQVNSRPLVLWIRANTGSYSHNKFIPPYMFGLIESQRRAIFDGMSFGDGSIRKTANRMGYTTVSHNLMLDYKLLAQSLGYSVSCWTQEESECTFRGETYIAKKKYNLEVQDLKAQSRPRATIDAGHLWGPIYDVQPNGLEHVWDLEVEEDHSFVVEGVVCHNSVGKSKSIAIRCLAFPFVHPGQEMVITGPEGNHVDAITGIIEHNMENIRLTKEMMVKGKKSITHKPFHIQFQNGARIMGRIPQRDGRGIKGIHPIWLEMDEAQDYPKAGFEEIIETLKMASVGSSWRIHGVSKGGRDHFFKFTLPSSGFKVHRITAMHRPSWSDDERQKKIASYGSKDSPDYKRNILGQHGDATAPLFVLHRLMSVVDLDEGSHYNSLEYVEFHINNEQVVEYGDKIEPLLDSQIPSSHQSYKRTWIGMDIGLTYAPSALVIFGEVRKKPTDPPTLKLLCKILLERISTPHQLDAILWLCDFYKPQAFALDRTGIGLPMLQDLQHKAKNNPKYAKYLDIIKGYNFSEKILVDFDDSIEVDPDIGDAVKEAGIKRNVLEYSSDKLRQLVDEKRIMLPFDRALLDEFQGQTYSYKAEMDAYGRKRSFSTGEFHALDATRMAILAFVQNAIEKIVHEEKWEPIYDMFIDL